MTSPEEHAQSLATAPTRGSAPAVKAPPPPPIIALEQVTKVYDTGPQPVQVLHGVSLEIAAGEFVAIIGASGSGKSTLMNILGCLDRPTTGTYRFSGRDVADLDRDGLASLRRNAFGFVFQQYNLIPTATAAGNGEMPAVYAGLGPAERHERAEGLLAALGLADRVDHRPNELSGGQQQRVSLARALMNGGEVILADEPTGALDSRTGADVMALFSDLNRRGHTVIVITHEREVASHARRTIELRDGRILSDSQQQPEKSIASPDVDATSAFASPSKPARAGALLPMMGETLRMALRSMRAHLMRTLLTLHGIMIGVGAVVTMLGVGNGARKAVVDQISAMGTNLLLVRPGAPGQRFGGGVTSLVESDAEAIRELPNVLAALPEIQGGVTLRAGDRDYQSQALATTEDLPLVRNWPLSNGAFLSADDRVRYRAVAVLGQTVARLIFPSVADPVGRYILVNSVPFQVIGVMTPKGATPWGSDQDDIVMVPLSTGSLRLFGQRHLRSITIAVEDVGRINETQDSVSHLLLQRHRMEDFQLRNMASLIEATTRTQDTLTVLLGSIAAISLLVGGIGVMNIMLVSVTERTREIGIRLAVGARALDIRRQSLSEATLVSSLGGVVGVLAGIAVAMLLRSLGTPILLSAGPPLLAFGCSFVTGLAFGYAPARKASQLDPVVALSSE